NIKGEWRKMLVDPAFDVDFKSCVRYSVILKKLPEKLGDPGKFLIPYGFSELMCKALADLGASINLMPLSVWKKLGLPELISIRMTLELANRAICTPAGIARDVFIPVSKFTFPAAFVIVDYESDLRVPLILGRPFLRTARALINVHGEEMILYDGDERLTLNMRHDTSSYSNQPQKESINLINVFNHSSEDFLKNLFSNQPSGNPTFSSHPESSSPLHVDPLSGSTTYSSFPNPLLEELADELALITFPLKYDDDLQFDIKSNLKEIEYLLHHNPIQDIDSSLKDSIDQSNLAKPADNFVDSMPEMFTDEHALDYSSPSIFDEYDDDFLEVESNTENVYDDPFDSKGEKIKDIYSLIDNNKTAKDLWDALARHMLGSEYGEQDRKAAVLYEYKTFKATEGELLLDTYIRYVQVINDLKKCGYSKDNCELNFKFLNNLQPEWKQYATMMRQNKNLMDINVDALYNILKQNQGDVNDAMGSKKKTVVVTSDPLALIAEKTNVSRSKEKTDNKKVEKKDDEKKRDMTRVKCYNCKNEGHFAKDCKKAKVKDYEYYKTKMLLAKKDKDEQVLLAEDQAWMESSNDLDQDINANMVFMAQIEKVLSDSETSSSSADEKIYEVSYYLSESESESEFETSEYYDNSTNYGLFVNKDDDQEIFHDAIESASENFIKNHIDSQKDYDKSDVDHNDSEEKDQLVDKLIRKFNKKIVKCQNRVEKANQQSKDFEIQNNDLQDKYDVLKNQTTTFKMNNKELNEQLKELIDKNNDLLAKTKVLKDQL
nr:reverse transcriptase domain-containing protein [Tanacetum cinerariifolium]